MRWTKYPNSVIAVSGRGLLRDDPLVVMLDEPTSALDAETEHNLFERFVDQARDARTDGRATVLVSHRFSTARMDRVPVGDRGRRLTVSSRSAGNSATDDPIRHRCRMPGMETTKPKKYKDGFAAQKDFLENRCPTWYRKRAQRKLVYDVIGDTEAVKLGVPKATETRVVRPRDVIRYQASVVPRGDRCFEVDTYIFSNEVVTTTKETLCLELPTAEKKFLQVYALLATRAALKGMSDVIADSQSADSVGGLAKKAFQDAISTVPGVGEALTQRDAKDLTEAVEAIADQDKVIQDEVKMLLGWLGTCLGYWPNERQVFELVERTRRSYDIKEVPCADQDDDSGDGEFSIEPSGDQLIAIRRLLDDPRQAFASFDDGEDELRRILTEAKAATLGESIQHRRTLVASDRVRRVEPVSGPVADTERSRLISPLVSRSSLENGVLPNDIERGLDR